jgi:hypothetical protein
MLARAGRRSLLIAAGLVLVTLASSGIGVASAAADDPLLSFTSTPTVALYYPQPLIGNWDAPAVTGGWSPSPTARTYQWYLDGSPVDGATDRFYTPQQGDIGRLLNVVVTATAPGYEPSSVSTPAQIVMGQITAVVPQTLDPPRPGHTLTVEPVFTPSDVSVSYQWTNQHGKIAGATSNSFTPTDAESGLNLDLDIVATKPLYVTLTTVAWFNPVTYDYIQTYGFAVQGTTAVGSTLSVNTTAAYWYPRPTSWSYQWLRDGADIPGASNSSYTLIGDDAGHRVTLRLTGSVDGFPDASRISNDPGVVTGPFTTTTTPQISGVAQLGKSLTAVVPGWTPAATHYDYAWFVDGVKQTSTSSTFTPTDAAEIGKAVTLQVTGSSPTQTATSSAMSLPTAPIAQGIADLSHISIGTVRLNAAVRPKIAGAPATAPFAYQWTLNGTPIKDATDATYVPQPGDYGKQLRVIVKVAGGADGYAPASGTSNAETVKTGSLGGGGLTVSGTDQVGQTLTATRFGWAVLGVHIQYEWFTMSTPWQSLSTSNKYTLRASDLGQTVVCVAQASLPHYITDGWYGDAVGPIGRGVFSTAPTVTVTGSASVGSTLTAHHSAAAPSSAVTYRYQWYSQANAAATPITIAHATGATYELSAAQAGHILTVRVTAAKSGYTSIVGISAGTASVIGQRPLSPRLR